MGHVAERMSLYWRQKIAAQMKKWLKFFWVGIIETEKDVIDTVSEIIALRDKIEKDTIVSLGKRLPNAKALLTYLYSKIIRE